MSSLLSVITQTLIRRQVCFQSAFKQTSRSLSSNPLSERFSICLSDDQISVAESVIEQHSHDESFHPAKRPDIVLFPSNTDQVSSIARICSENRIPMVAFGTGTGLEGGVSAPQGGVCVNMTKMDQVRDVFPEDFCTTVEPGVTRVALNTYLRDTGLWFPIDPGADASVCGMAATSASGTNAVRYGTMRENVMGLEIVLPDGRVLHTGGLKNRAKKSAAGYNLTNLFVGSEGTLGFITAATVKLHGIPSYIAGAVCEFDSVETAAQTALDIIQCNIPIARVELLDSVMMDAVNRYAKLNHAIKPHLFLEFHGFSQDALDEQVTLAQDLAQENGGENFNASSDATERDVLWKARHNAWYAAIGLRKGCKGYSTDICVPLSELPAMVKDADDKIHQLGLTAPIVGHIGDGNFHCLVVIDPDNEDELRAKDELSDFLALKAIERCGTCTGEHGIGLGKRKYLSQEFGNVTLSAMRDIKKAFDPLNIMNPTKVL